MTSSFLLAGLVLWSHTSGPLCFQLASFHVCRRPVLYGFHPVGWDSHTGCAVDYFCLFNLLLRRQFLSASLSFFPLGLFSFEVAHSTREESGVLLLPVLELGKL